MNPLAEVHRIAELHEMTVIPCAVPFPHQWITKDEWLFVSPDLTSAGVEQMASWLRGKYGPKLRIVIA